MDDNSHGTHVAGIIGSNDSYYKGMASGAKLLVAKVLNASGKGSDSDVIAGIDWCLNNSAQIISMSLGGDRYLGTCDEDPVAQAVNNAVNSGVAVVASAGNSGQYGLGTPACASGSIAVGATDKTNNVVGFSSKGSELDIVAPGYKIKSTIPGNWWSNKSGTSMSAPHVSGVIALMLEANPLLSVTNIKKILNETSDPVNKCYECTWSNGECIDYYGVEIDCNKNVTGAGIVNASSAVRRAQNNGCVFVKVQYQDGCPVQGADVWLDEPNYTFGKTDISGEVYKCGLVPPGNYLAKAYYPVNVEFGTNSIQVDSGWAGNTILTGSYNYPAESCGDSECSGMTWCD
jgi:subtilisin family serine protease